MMKLQDIQTTLQNNKHFIILISPSYSAFSTLITQSNNTNISRLARFTNTCLVNLDKLELIQPKKIYGTHIITNIFLDNTEIIKTFKNNKVIQFNYSPYTLYQYFITFDIPTTKYIITKTYKQKIEKLQKYIKQKQKHKPLSDSDLNYTKNTYQEIITDYKNIINNLKNLTPRIEKVEI